MSAVRSEVWVTARSTLIAPAGDPNLVLDLTSYFEDIDQFGKDLDLLHSVSVGAGAAMSSSPEVRKMLMSALLKITENLVKLSSELAARTRAGEVDG